MSDPYSRRSNPFAGAVSERIMADQANLMLDDSPLIKNVVQWLWHVPTSTVHYSREWRHILLRPDDETVQTTISSWWPLVHSDDIKPFLEASRDIVEGVTEDYRTLFRILRADGSWAWLLSHGKVTEKSEGGPLLVSGTLMDITALRKDIKFLHGNADMCYPYRHATPQEQGRRGNPAPGEAQGAVSHFLPGMRLYYNSNEALPAEMGADQSAFVQGCIDKVFADGLALRETRSFATSYGHTVTGEYCFWPEFDSGGIVTSVTTQFWDLTDKILGERRARLNEMRLDALHRLTQMSGAPEDEVLSFVMDSLVKLTGSASGFLYFPDLYPDSRSRMVWSHAHYAVMGAENLPLDRLPAEFEGVTTDDSGRPYQRIIRNGNCLQPVWKAFGGKVQALRYIAAPVFDDGRVVCVAGVRDKESIEYLEDDLIQLEAFVYGAWLVLRRHAFVRELERAKEAAEEAKEIAERANKVKDEFLANVSHELRTPLNGMLGMLQLLDTLPLTEQQREYVRTASISGKALLRIISDILDFSRIESGKMRLQIEPFDFKSAFESSLGLFRREAEARGLAFEVKVDERIPKAMLGDDARVRQILFNIVGNAIKFTNRGGIQVECSLLPQGDDNHIWVYLAVRDTGIGISSDNQMKIFDAFTQIDSSSTRKYAGTGLGLSIVRHLVALMGGGLTLESKLNAGTTVHASLRFSPVPQAVEYPEAAEPHNEKADTKPLHILVAEDDTVSRYAIQSILQRLGHTPVCVPNGRLALEVLQLHPFDCFLTDIQMPDMDGLEVVRRIRENRIADIAPTDTAKKLLEGAIPGGYGGNIIEVPGDLMTVTVSAHTMRGDRERFLEAGMDFYISKPVIMKELDKILRTVAAKIAQPNDQA